MKLNNTYEKTKCLKGRRCLLLGGGGFIGTNLCRQLVAEGAEVTVISPHVIAEQALLGATWVRATLEDLDLIEPLIRQDDYIFHMVSTTVPASSNENVVADITSNILPTLRLLDTLVQKQIARMVFLSSGGTIYGRNAPIPTPENAANEPLCSYGIHKLTIEKYLALYRYLHEIDAVALRVANPFGPYQIGLAQGVVAAIIRKAISNQPITIWGDGRIVRDYIYVSDLTQAIVRAALIDDPEAPRVYNVGSGVGRSIREILETVQAIHGKALDIVNTEERAVDLAVSILDISQARVHLGWIPQTPWETAITKTYDWVMTNPSM